LGCLFEQWSFVKEKLLERVAEVVQEVPAVGYLRCLRRSTSSSVDRAATAVAGNHFNGRMGCKPSSNCI